jgi:hypothetical protein
VAPLDIDHVLIAVRDLASAARELEERHGLGSVEGGRHPAWGTANRVVPLGRTYIELISIVDSGQAAGTNVGQWVARTPLGRPMGWVVRTPDLDPIAARLRLETADGSRTTPDGRTVRWRSAGIDEAAAEPTLPFFIEWGADVAHPGAVRVKHHVRDVRIERIVVAGDADRLASWLGGHRLIDRGSRGPAVRRVGRPRPRWRRNRPLIREPRPWPSA